MNKWDEWRRNYPKMSHADQITFALDFKANLNDNKTSYRSSLTAKHLHKYFTDNEEIHCHILEMGGWRGGLANQILGEDYWIDAWINYEIALDAILYPHCIDERYLAVIPSKPLWEFSSDQLKCDYFVASHVFEHIQSSEAHLLIQLLQKANIKRLFLDVPTDESRTKWVGYPGTHISSYTQKALIDTIKYYGFKLEIKDDSYLQFKNQGDI